jgi:hypothetical protein
LPPQGQLQDSMVILAGFFFLQQSGRILWSCCIFFFKKQQQVWLALRSGEQPQMSQLPEHSPVTAWATLWDFRVSGARGLRMISE